MNKIDNTFPIRVQPESDYVHFDFLALKVKELFGLNFKY
tara:strand:+ start:238 stop:354 length:117 start_codon:yes stop_codon:yes gene_type:complete